MLVDDQVLEAVAAQVHAAWADEKLRQGYANHVYVGAWIYNTADTRCSETCDLPPEKHHPDMLPYSALAEHVKAYDRVTARAALAGIEAAGYRLVKECEPC